MPVKIVNDDANFQAELDGSGSNLVVVDFTASWCGPCLRIAPIFEELSNKYARGAVFLKVDVDRCQATAEAQGINAMPTFIFYRNKVKLARIQGADPAALENKIRELVGNSGDAAVGGESSDSGIPGHMDLLPFIMKSDSEALNESDDHPFEHCLSSGSSQYLESDVDEQIIMNIAFTQNVKLHSIKIKAPADKGPKTIKFFMNQPRTLDFDQALSMEPVQTLELTAKDLTNSTTLPLKFVKFQNVQNLVIFVLDNLTGTETTRIDHISLIGSPVNTTNMSDFKRVAGKKGESH